MGKNHITIHDLAKILNLNASTVSRALNDHPKISAETKILVGKLAKKMNYQPNALASSLRKGSANTVGLIIPRVNRNFFASAIEGIEAVLNKAGYQLIIAQSNESQEKEKKCISSLLNSRVDGIIISVSWETTDLSHLLLVLNKKVPLIFFDRIPQNIEAGKVMLNDYLGAYKATEYLITHGYKRIAHLEGPRHLLIYAERRRGYIAALSDYGIIPDESIIIENCLTQERGYEAAKELTSMEMAPDALFCASDYSALGSIMFLKDNGFSIPGDMAVFGFSNEPFTKLIDPPLSSIEQFPYKMGETAAQLLLEEVKDKNFLPRTIEIMPEMMVRKSVIRVD
jgi:LacI family transcriptional regulator